MLKITEQQEAASDSTVLILEGQLTGPWVTELHACWRKLPISQQSCAVIDLSDVTFIDADGKAVLARLWQQGATFRAAGCLNISVVEEITKNNQADSSDRQVTT